MEEIFEIIYFPWAGERGFVSLYSVVLNPPGDEPCHFLSRQKGEYSFFFGGGGGGGAPPPPIECILFV